MPREWRDVIPQGLIAQSEEVAEEMARNAYYHRLVDAEPFWVDELRFVYDSDEQQYDDLRGRFLVRVVDTDRTDVAYWTDRYFIDAYYNVLVLEVADCHGDELPGPIVTAVINGPSIELREPDGDDEEFPF